MSLKYLFSLFLFPSLIWSLYLGNPSATELPLDGLWISPEASFGWKLGYEGSLVRYNQIKEHNVRGRRGASCAQSLNQGVIALNWINRVDIYGGLGTLSSELNYRAHPSFVEVEAHEGFSWEIGGRALLLYWNEFSFGFDVKLLASTTSDTNVIQNGSLLTWKEAQFHTKQWQIGGGLSYRIDEWITPYLGLIYNMSKFRLSHMPRLDGGKSKITFNEREKYIIALGLSLTASKAFNFTLEAGLLGENRLSFDLNFRF